jgi:N-acetylmuramoyl-L-alanine amidase/Putative peptidoglycan binding domain
MPWFDCATKRPIGTNTGGVISNNLGLILHHAVGNGSLWAFFNNPSSQVSAHFWVAKSGLIEQYVDTSVVAWHGRSLNSRYVGVETEGCGAAPHAEPMPQAMIDALARIYKEGNRRHGWPYSLASSDGQRGFGFHRMAVNTACPCDVRLNQRQNIMNIAQGQPPGPPGPTPPPSPAPPSGSAPPFPGTMLRDFTTGHGTLEWQAQMKARGWSIIVDNHYGPGSADICRRFQTEKGLSVDGVVGPQTWNASWTAPVT